MRATIDAPGDPSVGIPATQITVDGLEPQDKDDREYMRRMLAECFNDLLDDDTSIWFETEAE